MDMRVTALYVFHMARAAPALSVALCALFFACNAEPMDAPSPEPEPTNFIAFATNFQDFRSWETFVRPNRSDVPGCLHSTCLRTDYLNQRPPPGSTAFPIKTMIVKDLDNPAGRQIFAMVKRGGGYNADGAVGWEWFELEENADGSVKIVWRGLGAPDDEVYGLPGMNGGCNQCHTIASGNDYVHSEDLTVVNL